MFLGQVPVARPGRGQPEAGVVQGDATELVTQGSDYVAIVERPGRVAVQQQQRRPRSFVHVMDGVPVDGDEAALEREQLVVDPCRPSHDHPLFVDHARFSQASLKLSSWESEWVEATAITAVSPGLSMSWATGGICLSSASS